jgi:hypothetical protein
MTPSLIVHLWRERWGKAEQSIPNKPYLFDKVYLWGIKIASGNLFAIPGVTLLVIILFAAFALFLANIRFSLNGQISFAGLIVAMALLLRRYGGPFFSLCLIGLTLFSCLQYFSWRFGQTLLNQFGWNFVFAFAWASLEMVVLVYFATGWFSRLVPVRESSTTMTEPEQLWPSVQIVLLTDGAKIDSFEIEQGQQFEAHLKSLPWPEKKLLVSNYILEGTDPASRFGQIDRQISESLYDLVAFIEPKALAKTELSQWLNSSKFLERIAAWFMQDVGLGFLYGRNGFLSNQFNRSEESIIQQFDALSLPISIIRTSAWKQLGPHSADRKLKLIGRKSSLLISSKTENLELFKVDRANSSTMQAFKKNIRRWHEMIGFYKSLGTNGLLIAPLALLIFGAQLISAKFDWFAALGLPAVLLSSITQSRTNTYSRWSSWNQFKEAMLAVYFLLLTPLKFITAIVKNPKLLLHRLGLQMSASDLYLEFFVVVAFFGNLIGLLHSAYFLMHFSNAGQEWRMFFMMWAAINCLLLLSRQAIEHEKARILWFAKNKTKQDGTIRLHAGRTVVCQTVNFPNEQLILKLPVDVKATYGLSEGHTIAVHFSHNNQHFFWNALIVTVRERQVIIQTPSKEPSYLSMQQALLVRGKDWPAWLPLKNADRPFPKWFYDFIESLPGKMIEWGARFSGLFTWNSLSRLWTSKQ